MTHMNGNPTFGTVLVNLARSAQTTQTHLMTSLPGFEVEMREAREEYVACKLLCETAYCVSICDRQYQEKVQDIYDRYGHT